MSGRAEVYLGRVLHDLLLLPLSRFTVTSSVLRAHFDMLHVPQKTADSQDVNRDAGLGMPWWRAGLTRHCSTRQPQTGTGGWLCNQPSTRETCRRQALQRLTCNIDEYFCLPVMWAVPCAVVQRGLSAVCNPLWREIADVHHR